MRHLLMAGFLLGMLAGAAAAQSTPQVVHARIVSATNAVHPNAPAEVAVIARVASGYHINDHHPSLDYLIPTEVKLEPPPQVTVKNVIYPKGELKRFAFSDKPLSVYQGSVVVGAVLKVARAVPPGVVTVKGKLSYQACNDHACLPPTSVPLTLSLKVVGPKVPLKHLHADVFKRIQSE
jgi:thiol:disulfide interchange protein DsbD